MSEQLCPLCQQANLCKAGTAEQNQCWCMAKQFPAELLAQVPDQNSCICVGCFKRFVEQAKPVQQFKPQ
ncbi:cysteine-rich CWC family protein [Rheinheimera soli]|uniref:cysteine-rich CWC family protein n=1 Tax=Rheinheimera soli TaxID=443616 RepID=UPI001E3FAEBB|nr:cysteine-rich CWC family protein [Rheinheimera soli]